MKQRSFFNSILNPLKLYRSCNLSGFTLVEMLVTVNLTILILLSAYGLYQAGQNVYKRVGDKQEITQNAYVVLDRIGREIRQSREIISELPDVSDNPDYPPISEIEFLDGHTSICQETDYTVDSSNWTITLSNQASDEDDYYNELYMLIISGTGQDQRRKIIDYDGINHLAKIQDSWTVLPDQTSQYTISGGYYYVRYWQDGQQIKRTTKIYYFSDQPNIYIDKNARDIEGDPPQALVLTEELVGEYFANFKVWGNRPINCEVELKKNHEKIYLQNQITGRNLF
ncbi:MAG: type II secretion system protein [Candidatus Aenigmarchaeota archaeon]|nr:type II secretion system protein [Candidatus Aenigmarchaeota archaeon]